MGCLSRLSNRQSVPHHRWRVWLGVALLVGLGDSWARAVSVIPVFLFLVTFPFI